MRSMPTARWSGASATTICMVEQLGLAMIPRGRCAAASGLTSATTSGTSGSWRKAEELSITTAPAAANRGACSFETSPPAANSAMSTPAGSNAARSCTSSSSSPKSTWPPAERLLASARTSDAGNRRSARIDSIASPTAPVAPTTATRKRRSDIRALPCLAGDPRRHLAHVAALRAVAQRLVDQFQSHHRLADGGCADAHAGIMAAGGDHLNRIAFQVHAGHRQAQAGGGLERHRTLDALARADATQHAAGAVGQEAFRRHHVTVLAALLRHAGKAVSDLHALDRIDRHHRRRQAGIELAVHRLAPAGRHALGHHTHPRADRIAGLAQ